MTTHLTAIPRFSVAGAFLEGLAGQDFDRLASTLDDNATLSALVPLGLREAHGPDEIRATFARWFGDTDDYDVVEAVVGEVGSRLHLRWRMRLRAARLGDGWFVVEQQVYADTTTDGRITRMSLLCSGYCPEIP